MAWIIKRRKKDEEPKDIACIHCRSTIGYFDEDVSCMRTMLSDLDGAKRIATLLWIRCPACHVKISVGIEEGV